MVIQVQLFKFQNIMAPFMAFFFSKFKNIWPGFMYIFELKNQVQFQVNIQIFQH
jgi:hypothetical protein